MSGIVSESTAFEYVPGTFRCVGQIGERDVYQLQKSDDLWHFWKQSSGLQRKADSSDAGWTKYIADLSNAPVGSVQAWYADLTDVRLHAVKIADSHSLDMLLRQWGNPPSELVVDWQQQVDSSKHLSRDSLTATFAVLPDARLIGLRELLKESAVAQDGSAMGSTQALNVAPPFTPEEVLRALPHASPLESASQFKLSQVFEQAHTPAKALNQSGGTPIGGLGNLMLDKPEVAKSKSLLSATAKTPGIAPESKSSERRSALARKSNEAAWWKSKPVLIGAGVAGCLVAVAVFSLLPNATPQNERSEEPPALAQVDATLTTSEDAPVSEVSELDLSGVESQLDPSIGLDAENPSSRFGLTADAGNVALPSLSLESLLLEEPESGVEGNSPAAEVESFEGDQVAAVDGKQLPVADVPGLKDLSKSAEPLFPEQSDEDLADDEDENVDPVDNDADANAFEIQTVKLNRALTQLKVKPPAGFQKSTAAVRVEFELPEGVSMEPSSPILISGEGTDSRVFYQSEEGAAVRVYVKSLPRSTWKILIATRVELGSDIQVSPEQKVMNAVFDQITMQRAFWNKEKLFIDQARNHPRANRQAIRVADDLIESNMTAIDDIGAKIQDSMGLLPMLENSQFAKITTAVNASALPDLSEPQAESPEEE